MKGPYVIVSQLSTGRSIRWCETTGVMIEPFNTREEAQALRLDRLRVGRIPTSDWKYYKVIPLAQFIVETGQ